MSEESVTIKKEEYTELYYNDLFLSLLEEHGVNNWEGYYSVLKECNEQFEKENNE